MGIVRQLVRLLVAAVAALLVTVVVDPAAGLADTQPSPTQGMTVTPASGPVGTEVLVEGRGCGNLDEPVRLVFESGAGGTVGAVDLGEFEVSEQDAFRAVAIRIPDRMDPLQGVGGGPTRPGTYHFVTRPPTCDATFTVTAGAAAPAPPGELPFTGPRAPRLLAVAGGLLAAGAALLLLSRRRALAG